MDHLGVVQEDVGDEITCQTVRQALPMLGDSFPGGEKLLFQPYVPA